MSPIRTGQAPDPLTRAAFGARSAAVAEDLESRGDDEAIGRLVFRTEALEADA